MVLLAAYRGNVDDLRTLVEYGANPNLGYGHDTPLSFAILGPEPDGKIYKKDNVKGNLELARTVIELIVADPQMSAEEKLYEFEEKPYIKTEQNATAEIEDMIDPTIQELVQIYMPELVDTMNEAIATLKKLEKPTESIKDGAKGNILPDTGPKQNLGKNS